MRQIAGRPALLDASPPLNAVGETIINPQDFSSYRVARMVTGVGALRGA